MICLSFRRCPRGNPARGAFRLAMALPGTCGLAIAGFALALLALAGLAACSRDSGSGSAGAEQKEVVIYTALDQIFSEPILDRFEKETGIRVLAVYDTEAAKTVGLVNRLLAEKARPRCDVFWNNEILRTLLLKRDGVTQPYASPAAADIPAMFKDPENHWTGIAARARVIIYNKNLVAGADAPKRIQDLADPKWKGRCAMAKPLFGTTATEAAVLWWLWGPERAQAHFTSLRDNKVVQMPGNATVRDQVAQGEMAWGFTDSDDANGAFLDNRPTDVTFPLLESPDAKNVGILLIPNSLALIKGAPHPEAGKKLIDYLLSASVEETLAKSRSAQLPVRPHLAPPPRWEILQELPRLDVDWNAVLDALQPSAAWLDENFAR